jgi:integral membrane protein (TIGR01906 family)
MKVLNKIALWIIVVCFPVLLLASTLGILVNNIGTYNYIIEKYNVQLVTGIDELQLRQIYQHWIDFYNNKEESPRYEYPDNQGEYRELLSEKELIHLYDVKGLMRLDYIVISISLILFAISVLLLIYLDRSRWQMLARAVFRGSSLTVILFVVIVASSVFCFDQLFILFHKLSFSNDFWILNPATDYLAMMFPGGFFSDVVIIAFSSILVTALVCGIVTFTILKRKRLAM